MGKVLVTGASGRFAQHMVAALRDKYDVALFSRSPIPEDRADLPAIIGDLNNYEDCVKAVQGVDVIHHLGAVPWASDNVEGQKRRAERGLPVPPFDATIKTNILGAYYLMKAAVDAGVKTVVMTGSNCAFGHCGYGVTGQFYPVHYLPLDEEHPSACVNSYAWTKFAGEDLLHTFTRAFGIRTYITRPAHICDETKRRDMAATAQPASEWSGGLWGWVASEDLAEMQLLIQQAANDLPLHDVFVGNNLDTEALEPTMELIERFRPELLPVTEGLTGYDALFSSAHVKEMLGWLPYRSWREYLPTE